MNPAGVIEQLQELSALRAAGAPSNITWEMNALDVSLDNSAFLSKWTDGKFSASERRIYITKWAGDAFDALVASKHISKHFLKTGWAVFFESMADQIPSAFKDYLIMRFPAAVNSHS